MSRSGVGFVLREGHATDVFIPKPERVMQMLFTEFWTVLECVDGDDHRAEGKDLCCKLQS